jgi:hypothetical protein
VDLTNQHKSARDRYSKLAKRAGIAVVIGVAVEIGVAWLSDRSLVEKIGNTVADLLIGVGVAAELWFAHKAEEAGDRVVAEAEARAAEALKSAVEDAKSHATSMAMIFGS